MTAQEKITARVAGFHQMIITDINKEAKSRNEAGELYKRYIQDVFICIAAQAHCDNDGNVDIEKMNSLASKLDSIFWENAKWE